MEKTRRINQKYEQGLQDGRLGVYAPGLIFGIYRTMYHKGYKQGARMMKTTKRLIKIK
jgi:hypothetical protein